MLLQVTNYHAGAGEVLYEKLPTVAHICRTFPVTCDNSCQFVTDGVCDYGSNDVG
jgi:hypothetical protein